MDSSFSFNFGVVDDASGQGQGVLDNQTAAGRGSGEKRDAHPSAAGIQWVQPSVCSSASLQPAHPIVEVRSGLRRYLVDADGVTGVELDVVSGSYEGGAKMWECTRDLLSYLAGPDGTQLLQRPGLVACDVGCGAGLLGIAALQSLLSSNSKAASEASDESAAGHVCFMDMNASVLERVTAANVALNLAEGSSSERAFDHCSFLAGPWSGVVAAAQAISRGELQDARLTSLLGSVDLILTSETLYNVSYYGDLYALLSELLKPESGVALIATKRFYYGVGGGTEAFISFASAPKYGLAVTKLRAFQDGHSMIRDLLQVRRVSSGR